MMSLFIVLSITSTNCSSKSADVIDFYGMLSGDGIIDNVLENKNGNWSIVSRDKDKNIKATGKPVVDAKNGYIKAEYEYAYCNIIFEIAHFVSSDKTNFAALVSQWACKREMSHYFHFYRQSFGGIREIEPAPIVVTYKDFLNEDALRDMDPEIEKNASKFIITYKLPRVGTDILVSLLGVPGEPLVEPYDHQLPLIKKMNEFIQKNQKYSGIEYSWDMKEAGFVLKRKIKI
jgi:hypothetical protein